MVQTHTFLSCSVPSLEEKETKMGSEKMGSYTVKKKSSSPPAQSHQTDLWEVTVMNVTQKFPPVALGRDGWLPGNRTDFRRRTRWKSEEPGEVGRWNGKDAEGE